jgi:hypothetical protein
MMAYFMIDNVDYSNVCSGMKVTKNHYYNSQTNANGDTVIDYINKKRQIEVTIIPLDDTKMAELQNAINNFNVSISFRNPKTNILEENVNCIIENDEVEYYTIQVNKVMYNAFTLTFTEL